MGITQNGPFQKMAANLIAPSYVTLYTVVIELRMHASYKKFLQTLKWCHSLQGNSHLKKLSWYGTHWLHLRCNHNKTPVFESLIGWIVIPFLSMNPLFAKNLRNVSIHSNATRKHSPSNIVEIRIGGEHVSEWHLTVSEENLLWQWSRKWMEWPGHFTLSGSSF